MVELGRPRWGDHAGPSRCNQYNPALAGLSGGGRQNRGPEEKVGRMGSETQHGKTWLAVAAFD